MVDVVGDGGGPEVITKSLNVFLQVVKNPKLVVAVVAAIQITSEVGSPS